MGMESCRLTGTLLGRVGDVMAVESRTARDEAIRPCTLGVQTLLNFCFFFLYIESNGAFADATGAPPEGGPLANLGTVFFVMSRVWGPMTGLRREGGWQFPNHKKIPRLREVHTWQGPTRTKWMTAIVQTLPAGYYSFTAQFFWSAAVGITGS